jgi:hypothetical protein
MAVFSQWLSKAAITIHVNKCLSKRNFFDAYDLHPLQLSNGLVKLAGLKQ